MHEQPVLHRVDTLLQIIQAVLGVDRHDLLQDNRSDIHAFVGHQANLRILSSVAKRLRLPRERVVSNIADVANTAAASIPLALADAAAQGRIGSGDRLLLTAFGGGLTWAAAAVRWGDRVTPLATSDAALPPTDKSGVELFMERQRSLGRGGSV